MHYVRKMVVNSNLDPGSKIAVIAFCSNSRTFFFCTFKYFLVSPTIILTTDGDNGISKFRVKNVWPFRDNNWKPYSPQEYTERLWRLREKHECYKLRLSYRPAQGLF